MTISYLFRLGCLSFSAFLLTHFLMELLVLLIAGRVMGKMDSIRPRVAESILFGLRLLPSVFSVLFVVGFCIPSYLIHEPYAVGESVSLVSVALAAGGFSLCLLGLRRAYLGIRRSGQYQRNCEAIGSPQFMGDDGLAVCVIETEQPVLAMAGIVRPFLIASSGLKRLLPPEQMDVALRHEWAHWVRKDNWKRLLMLAAPGVLRLTEGFLELEIVWSRYAERAADDVAIAGDSDRAIVLAGALVVAARMGSTACPAVVSCSLLDNQANFSTRVDRLLKPAEERDMPNLTFPLGGGLALLTTGIIAYYPATLAAVYQALEELLH